VTSHPDCDFCAIARGESKAEIVCEGKDWIAFLPLEPATAGHSLVIPREHVSNLWQADRGTAHELMGAVIRVGNAITAGLRPDGMNLITSAGEAADQSVFHLHLHVVPRWEGDGFGRIWPWKSSVPPAARRDAAGRIRAACGADGE
jgi:histidine triad (HIT) family protein